MEQTSKYFLKTSSALADLQQTVAELKNSSDHAQAFIDKQISQIETLRHTILKEAQKVDNIIADLNGAIK